MHTDLTTTESRLRHIAQRDGLAVQKCRSRNPTVPDFGLYRVVDPDTGVVVIGSSPWDYSLTLDELQDFLTQRSGRGQR